MKDERAGVAIEEFVGLAPKMYWFEQKCCCNNKS